MERDKENEIDLGFFRVRLLLMFFPYNVLRSSQVGVYFKVGAAGESGVHGTRGTGIQ